MAAFAPGATADPKKGATFSDTCDNGQTVELTFNGNGDFTPGHLHLRHHSHRPRRDASEDSGRSSPSSPQRSNGFRAAAWRVWRSRLLVKTVAAPRNATSRAAMPLRLHAPYPTLETPQSRAMTTEVRSAAHEFVSEWTARQVEARMRPG